MESRWGWLAVAALWLAGAEPSQAQVAASPTVRCGDYEVYGYLECPAPYPMQMPVLVQQLSALPCILNRTWGFDRPNASVWVAQGCVGVFADNYGYVYGQGGNYDYSARVYDNYGNDVGPAVAAGAVLGAILTDALSDHHKHRPHVGCPGPACPPPPPWPPFRGPPFILDARPHFNEAGKPNFDERGRYIGPRVKAKASAQGGR